MTWIPRVSDVLAGRKSPQVKAHFWDDPHAALSLALQALTVAVFESGGLVAGSVALVGSVIQLRDIVAVSADGRAVLTFSGDLDAASIPILRSGAVVLLPEAQTVQRSYAAGGQSVTDDMPASFGRAVVLLAADSQTLPDVPVGGAVVARFGPARPLQLVPETSSPALRFGRSNADLVRVLLAIIAPDAGLNFSASGAGIRLGFGGPNAPYSVQNPPYLSAQDAVRTQKAASAPVRADVWGAQVAGGQPDIQFNGAAATPHTINEILFELTLAYADGPKPVACRVYARNADGTLGALLATGRGISPGWTAAPVSLLLDHDLTLPERFAIVFAAADVPAGCQIRTSYGNAPTFTGGLSGQWTNRPDYIPIFSLNYTQNFPRSVFGRLALDAMARSSTPLALADGEAYILAPAGAVPELRAKENGTEYRVAFTAV